MTTTDTDALRKRIALAQMDITEDHWRVIAGAVKRAAMEDADRVLPIVAEEVRKAKAEALREAASEYARWISGNRYASKAMEQFFNTCADQIESGASDEHR